MYPGNKWVTIVKFSTSRTISSALGKWQHVVPLPNDHEQYIPIPLIYVVNVYLILVSVSVCVVVPRSRMVYVKAADHPSLRLSNLNWTWSLLLRLLNMTKGKFLNPSQQRQLPELVSDIECLISRRKHPKRPNAVFVCDSCFPPDPIWMVRFLSRSIHPGEGKIIWIRESLLRGKQGIAVATYVRSRTHVKRFERFATPLGTLWVLVICVYKMWIAPCLCQPQCWSPTTDPLHL